MVDASTLKRLLIDAPQAICLNGIGVLQPFFKSAIIANDGTSIKAPQHGWMLFPETAEDANKPGALTVSSTLAEALSEGIRGSHSFEVAGVGLFLHTVVGFELIPTDALLQKCQEHFGLPQLSLKPQTPVKLLRPNASQQANKPTKSLRWLVQTAAVLAFILAANLLVLQVVLKDGALFTATQSSLGLFDTVQNTVGGEESSSMLPAAPMVSEVKVDALESTEQTKADERSEATTAAFQRTPLYDEISVVVGAFASKNNAERFLARLKIDGFNAKNLGQNQFGLTRIAIINIGDAAGNESFLNEIRANVSPDAWLLD